MTLDFVSGAGRVLPFFRNRTCACLLLPFLVLQWRWTDDLRLYAWVQFFPYFALLLLILVFPPKYTGTSCWIIAAVLHALAKLLEFYDEEVCSAGSLLSGHTVKHFAAAGPPPRGLLASLMLGAQTFPKALRTSA
jgi:hypothetical protein